MVDVIENAFQIASLIFCTSFSIYRILKTKDKSWVLLFFFFGSYLMGDLYWQAVTYFYGDTPSIALISDLSWYASFMFIYLLLYMENEKHKGLGRPREDYENSMLSLVPWLGPIFSTVMSLLYMQIGAIISNTIYGILMAVILYYLIDTVIRFHGTRCLRIRWLCHAIAFTCLSEFGSWTASFFNGESSFSNPYYWFNILSSISFTFYLWPLSKEVRS